jgi:hypothetical protein
MNKILCGTQYVLLDEPCLGLYEMNLQSPGSRGFHRYQIIYVMRDAKPVEMRRDMGKAKSFKANQLRIPGGAKDEESGKFYIEHTVGELVDIANQLRTHSSFDKRELAGVNKIANGN